MSIVKVVAVRRCYIIAGNCPAANSLAPYNASLHSLSNQIYQKSEETQPLIPGFCVRQYYVAIIKKKVQYSDTVPS